MAGAPFARPLFFPHVSSRRMPRRSRRSAELGGRAPQVTSDRLALSTATIAVVQVHLLECLKDGTVCAMTASRITASMRMMDAELYQFSATSCTLDAARSFPSLGHSVRVVERRTLGPILQMMRHRRAGRNIGSPCFLRSSLGWQSNASVCWKGIQYSR